MFIRHPNGKGKVVDSENAEVCDRSYLDRFSVVRENSTVWNSHITGSNIQGNSIVRNATIRNSMIVGAEVSGGIIENSEILCELVTGNARILNSRLAGDTRVGHDAKIFSSRIRNWTVKGCAVVRNWPHESDGMKGYISDGAWSRPPEVIRLNDITITESVVRNGVFHVFIGCREKTAERWLQSGPRYGRALKWSADEIRQAFDFISQLAARSEDQFTHSLYD